MLNSTTVGRKAINRVGGERAELSDWTVASMFSGAGGMDLGFKQAGFEIVWATDTSVNACKTYERNIGVKPRVSRIERVEDNEFPQAHGLIACTPCEGFSLIGERNQHDPRNYLYRHVVRCLKQTKPMFFVAENVRGLALLYNKKFLRLMLQAYDRAGYDVVWNLLDAKDYGVPQHRERVVIVGFRKDLHIRYSFPAKTHGPGLTKYATLRDAIGRMRPAKPDEYYNGYSKEDWPFFYMSRNRRADWGDYSFTIQAWQRHVALHPSSPPMKKLRKDHWTFTAPKSRYRRLSYKECAKIQTFPQGYEFVGSLESKYWQVGNAVPPLLAKVLAESLLAHLPAEPSPPAEASPPVITI